MNPHNHQPFTLEAEIPETMILCIHGILGSPGQFQTFSTLFNGKNISVKSLLLPGHGSNGKEFAFTKPTAWQDHVDQEISKLKEKYEFIYLMGHSLGGLIALNASIKQSINGIVLLNTPIRTRITWQQISLSFRVLISSKEKNNLILQTYRESFGVDLKDWWTIPLWIPRLLDVNRFGKIILNKLQDVNSEVLIYQSRQDETVVPGSAEILKNSLHQCRVTLNYLEKSKHAFFEINELQVIIKDVKNFIADDLIKSHLK
ncbi:MAG: hypothetical protein CVU41_10605 [Chloroflexi bacterium HGW-Chloroflexi-3]|nr:MAG: hypothetical protein CVU41_10605 [Chloroflexi bacterium HGW-Chloroflexi-3]